MLADVSRPFNSSTVGSPLGAARALTTAIIAKTVIVAHRNKYRTPSMIPALPAKLFFRLYGDEPVFRLPLLIRILPVSHVEEEVKIRRRPLVVLEVIVGR